MEQPITQENISTAEKAMQEGRKFFALALPMFLTQLALQFIQVNSVIQTGNYSTDVQAGIMLAGNLWFPVMIGVGGVLFFITPMIAQLFGANKNEEIGPLVRQGV